MPVPLVTIHRRQDEGKNPETTTSKKKSKGDSSTSSTSEQRGEQTSANVSTDESSSSSSSTKSSKSKSTETSKYEHTSSTLEPTSTYEEVWTSSSTSTSTWEAPTTSETPYEQPTSTYLPETTTSTSTRKSLTATSTPTGAVTMSSSVVAKPATMGTNDPLESGESLTVVTGSEPGQLLTKTVRVGAGQATSEVALSSTGKSTKLSNGAIGGIIAAAVVVLLIILGLLIRMCFRRRRKRRLEVTASSAFRSSDDMDDIDFCDKPPLSPSGRRSTEIFRPYSRHSGPSEKSGESTLCPLPRSPASTYPNLYDEANKMHQPTANSPQNKNLHMPLPKVEQSWPATVYAAHPAAPPYNRKPSTNSDRLTITPPPSAGGANDSRLSLGVFDEYNQSPSRNSRRSHLSGFFTPQTAASSAASLPLSDHGVPPPVPSWYAERGKGYDTPRHAPVVMVNDTRW